MDGLYSIWNISWVAHATISDPAGLLDANIFYPHRHALTFSEANILGGVVASPVWWLTGNPYAAHNAALMFAFCSTLIGTWLLVRRLSQNSGAAAVSAILFAFCPYFFSHSAHIQLLMAGGIPLAMLALHRLVDSPSPGRGAVLGLALAAQALACAYYGIFAGLMVGYGAVFLAVSRRLWGVKRFWAALAIAVVTSIVVVLPFFLPYLTMQREEGFRRSLADAVRYSAPPASYLASPAHAHQWLIPIARRWGWRADEVLFPGLLALTLGAAGLAVTIRNRRALSARLSGGPRSGSLVRIAWSGVGMGVARAAGGPLHRDVPRHPALHISPRSIPFRPDCGLHARDPCGVCGPTDAGDGTVAADDCRCGAGRRCRARIERAALSVGAGAHRSAGLWSARPHASGASRRISVLRRARRVPAPRTVHGPVGESLDAAGERVQRSHSAGFSRRRSRRSIHSRRTTASPCCNAVACAISASTGICTGRVPAEIRDAAPAVQPAPAPARERCRHDAVRNRLVP